MRRRRRDAGSGTRPPRMRAARRHLCRRAHRLFTGRRPCTVAIHSIDYTRTLLVDTGTSTIPRDYMYHVTTDNTSVY